MDKPKLSIIIVSWNVRKLLRKCLESIAEQTGISHEIFVVDNNSRDGSADMVAAQFPEVNLIRNKKNVGFGAANNQGLAKATGEYVIFLNDDTKITNHALDKMVKYLDDNNSVGVVGSRLLNPDHSLQAGTAREFPTFKVQATMLMGLHSLLRKTPWLKKYYMVDENFQQNTEVDQVMGASLMTRNIILKKLGSFDERFWIWFEEVDLCKRIKDAGYRIEVLANAEIIHHHGQSFVQVNKLSKFFHISKSIFVYSGKHHPLYDTWLLALIWPIGLLVALAVQILHLKPRK